MNLESKLYLSKSLNLIYFNKAGSKNRLFLLFFKTFLKVFQVSPFGSGCDPCRFAAACILYYFHFVLSSTFFHFFGFFLLFVPFNKFNTTFCTTFEQKSQQYHQNIRPFFQKYVLIFVKQNKKNDILHATKPKTGKDLDAFSHRSFPVLRVL